MQLDWNLKLSKREKNALITELSVLMKKVYGQQFTINQWPAHEYPNLRELMLMLMDRQNFDLD